MHLLTFEHLNSNSKAEATQNHSKMMNLFKKKDEYFLENIRLVQK